MSRLLLEHFDIQLCYFLAIKIPAFQLCPRVFGQHLELGKGEQKEWEITGLSLKKREDVKSNGCGGCGWNGDRDWQCQSSKFELCYVTLYMKKQKKYKCKGIEKNN